ncbi:MAG: hypothetical protein CVU89_04455 [Firmicutes bacterium HGW-Firmicutes-14]|nr:MAG: hypothetical protein CVU89_04455 [Firmicutes bacterium HGW-Firmicutes-14]
MDDYYKVLGIEQFATPEEIKRAYRLLAKRWHPDCNQGNVNSTEIFKRISQAYYVLSKPALKSEYDNRLRVYLNAQKEAARYDHEKAEKEAEVDEQLNSLNVFMHKMKAAFENIVYEDEDSPTIFNKLDSKLAKIRCNAKKTIIKIVDLMYEEAD